MFRRSATLSVLGFLLAVGCGGGEPEYYEARGVIRDVEPEHQRVQIEHEEIPDFMDAMTMYFDVPDEELLAEMQAGQEIDFLIEHDRGRVRVVDFEPASPGSGSPAE